MNEEQAVDRMKQMISLDEVGSIRQHTMAPDQQKAKVNAYTGMNTDSMRFKQ